MELLSGTAHLKRGGRNPTEGAKNRARSLTEARIYFDEFSAYFCESDNFCQYLKSILLTN